MKPSQSSKVRWRPRRQTQADPIAAELFTRCREAGFTPTNSNDLLVAAVAIAREVPLLAADSDFQKVASVSSLSLATI